jgi:G-rich domain on putative tyrosine kinase
MANVNSGSTNTKTSIIHPMAEEIHAIVGAVRRYRLVFICTFILVMIVGIIWIMTRPAVYRADSKILPTSMISYNEGQQFSGALQGLSSRLGLNLGRPEGNPSSTFPSIVFSREFFESIADRAYETQSGSQVTLVDLLQAEHADSLRQRAKAYRIYRNDAVRMAYDEMTGVTTIISTLGDPVAAASLARVCTEQLSGYVLEMKQKKNHEWENYLLERSAGARNTLLAAEDALNEFLVVNRSIASPGLRLEESRLKREVQTRQEIFLMIQAQLETAQLESKKNVSIITVIDPAREPLDPFKPKRSALLVMVFLLACLLSFVAVASSVLWQAYREYEA